MRTLLEKVESKQKDQTSHLAVLPCAGNSVTVMQSVVFHLSAIFSKIAFLDLKNTRTICSGVGSSRLSSALHLRKQTAPMYCGDR